MNIEIIKNHLDNNNIQYTSDHNSLMLYLNTGYDTRDVIRIYLINRFIAFEYTNTKHFNIMDIYNYLCYKLNKINYKIFFPTNSREFFISENKSKKIMRIKKSINPSILLIETYEH